MHYRVSYNAMGKRFACEYKTLEEAQRNYDDISVYDGVVSDVTLEPRSEGEPQGGPFELLPEPQRTTWDVLRDEDA